MPLNWMNIDDTPFQVMLFLEDFHIDYLTQSSDLKEALYISLKANSDVEWFFRKKAKSKGFNNIYDTDDDRHTSLVVKQFSWGRYEEPGDGIKKNIGKLLHDI